MPHAHSRALICLLLLGIASGCSMGKGDGWKFTKRSLDIRRVVGLKKDEPTPPQVPTRLVSTWTDTILNQQGEKSQRGFGGRLLFFNEEGEDPIRVEGQLVVYAYDERGRAAHETHPTRRYIFPAEQFVRHESEAAIGSSYSVWLPWDAVGGEQKNISLIARFESKAGPLIVGEQTKHLLPGVRHLASGGTAPAAKPIGEIQLTQFTQESKLQAPPQNQRPQVTSIALGHKSWEQRLSTPQSRSATKSTSNSNGRATTAVLPGPAR